MYYDILVTMSMRSRLVVSESGHSDIDSEPSSLDLRIREALSRPTTFSSSGRMNARHAEATKSVTKVLLFYNSFIGLFVPYVIKRSFN